MPSTYTTNLGIEKIATGEQSGTWGTTSNTNFDLIDEAVNGVEQVTLSVAGSSGSPNDLPITNGSSSDGRNKFIEFVDGGDLGGTAYVQLTPNDAEKVVHIRNSLSADRTITIFQGTYNASNDFVIPNGADVVLKFDGAGAGAVVSDVYVNLTPTKLTTADLVATTADINGGSVDGATLGTNSAITEAQVDNININGNTISSTDTNGNITLAPNGTGVVALSSTDLTFGDNDKAIFGAGSDLQIYHDSNASYIVDSGTGSLNIHGTDINLRDADGNSYINMSDNGTGGTVTLKHNTATKLTTKTDGILVTGELQADTLDIDGAADIAGTVTADGLTVDGDGTVNGELYVQSSNARIRLKETDTTDNDTQLQTTGGVFKISRLDDDNITATQRLTIDNATGDISFYEDTGTTAKLFWDASAERLGIGNATPATALDVTGTITADGLTVDGDAEVQGLRIDAVADVDLEFGYANTTHSKIIGDIVTASPIAGQLKFQTSTGGSLYDRMLIATNGDISFYEDTGTTAKLFWDASAERLGIGNATPATALDVTGTVTASDEVFADQYRLLDSGAVYRPVLSLDSDDTILGTGTTTGTRSIVFKTEGTERARIDSSGNVGIGGSPTSFGAGQTTLDLIGNNAGYPDRGGIVRSTSYDGDCEAYFGVRGNDNPSVGSISNHDFTIFTNNSEAMRIDSSGNLLVGKTSLSGSTNGVYVQASSGQLAATATNDTVFEVNRLSSDGVLVYFRQANNPEGNISVSGTTVSYNGGHLARWSRLADDSKDESIVKGTVMTNLDAMVEWSHDAVDEVLDEEGNVVTEAKEAYAEDNEQLNKMAVSSVEGDPNVAGVFVNWDEEDGFNDMNIAMTGDMVIRIAQGTTVARGDLLMSAGDGTAKPQGDDIVRSKTIAKVTSTHVSHTYDDGSYLVPCVLMAC